MRRSTAWILLALALLALWAWQQRAPAPTAPTSTSQRQLPPAQPRATPTARDATWPGDVPAETIATLQRIRDGGLFAHRQDGAVFQNRERLLPPQPHGYYREYTVQTPGARDRGARRIISGGQPPVEFFYSDDHYRSLRRLPARGAP